MWVIPGFAGGQLSYARHTGKVVWVSYLQLAIGGAWALRLDATGRYPYNSATSELTYGGCLPDYFSDLINRLKADLSADGYSVEDFGWDWRKDLRRAGDRLATEIRTHCTPSDPGSIVAHSTGGLVSRWAWRELVTTGESNLLRRIITLGTPHRGTYAAPRVFSNYDPSIDQVTTGIAFAYAGLGPGVLLTPLSVPTMLTFTQIFATFPCLYQLMPLLDAAALTADPEREKLYDIARWPTDRNLSADHMEDAKLVFGQFLRDAQSIPPPHVLTTVAGTGHSTPFRLDDASQIGKKDSLAETDQGDGTVTVESALVSGAEQLTVPVSHSGLTSSVTILDRIADMVREVRTPSTPTPSPATVAGPTQAAVQGPPYRAGVPHQPVTSSGQIVSAPSISGPSAGSNVSFAGSPATGARMFRVSIFWQQTDARAGGWTENFWNASTDAPIAMTRAMSLADALRELHGVSTNWVKIRVQAVPDATGLPVPRQVLPFKRAFLSNPVTTQVSDYPTTSIYLELRGGGHSTRQWIKGIKDNYCDAGGFLQTINPSYVTAINNVKDALSSQQFMIRYIDTAFAKQIVKSIEDTGIVHYSGPGINPAFPVRIGGAKQNTYVNGLWRVTSMTDDAEGNHRLRLEFFHPPLPFVPVAGKPYIKTVTYAFSTVSDIEGLMCTSHMIGRPIGQHTGRRRKKK